MSDASKLLPRPAGTPEPFGAGEGTGPGPQAQTDELRLEVSSDGSDIAEIEELDTSSSDDDLLVAKRARP